MKRFYKIVGVTQVDNGHQVTLDGRGIKTSAGAAQIVPSAELAQHLAAEWDAQGEKLDPATFILRDLADYAIDIIGPERDTVIAKILTFGESDTLCYRGEPDDALFERQEKQWEPLVTQAEQRHQIRFERISGVIHRPQPINSLKTLRDVVAQHDDFTLSALQTCSSIAASLIVGLAALEDGADAEALFTISNLEEDWQAELWGWEAEAAQTRAARLKSFTQAADFARLVRQG
ncbi:molecular chaperone [Altererythrobacter indicus]|uniref:Molecular chaperone n=1 Tax=Altericroceibacterium indicum TaxID=374177 RepID=A0A845AB18_9SPHN|nr:molecular chaperone [Altericroceibacterium indicum]